MNCFLSGWAVTPKNLNCEIIDSTKLVSKYKTIENIAQNFDKIFPQNIKTLSAWSMGAIIVLGVLQKIKAEKIILHSPALKFSANDEISKELDKLQKNIVENKETAVKLFSRKCGIPKELVDASYYGVEELSAGLDFLRKTEIKFLEIHRSMKIIVICGENDKIISPNLSFEVAEKLGAEIISIPNGSHFNSYEKFKL
jgi:hypothetical protein